MHAARPCRRPQRPVQGENAQRGAGQAKTRSAASVRAAAAAATVAAVEIGARRGGHGQQRTCQGSRRPAMPRVCEGSPRGSESAGASRVKSEGQWESLSPLLAAPPCRG